MLLFKLGFGYSLFYFVLRGVLFGAWVEDGSIGIVLTMGYWFEKLTLLFSSIYLCYCW